MAAWVRSELRLHPDLERELIDGIEALLAHEKRRWERTHAEDAATHESTEPVDHLVDDLTVRLNGLLDSVARHEATIGSLTRHFEYVVADLTDRVNRDPKTQLVSFPHFLDQLAAHLETAPPGRWCAVGFADITAFKWYNDALGHALGDRIIETVARLLREQVRLNDLIAHQQLDEAGHDLHARFGGDEFCFLIPYIDGVDTAVSIANRFREAVHGHDWTTLHPQLATRPVGVDVGVACVELGSMEDRRHLGPQLAQELLMYADKLMYQAKTDQATRPYPIALRVHHGSLTTNDAR